MRIVVPAHYQLVKAGIGTLARGLLPALQAQCPDDVELVIPELPRRRGLERIGSSAGGVARLRYEQWTLRRAVAGADLAHFMDARAIVGSRTPFVMTVHDVSYLDNPEWFSPAAARYKRAMLALALRQRPAAIVFDSRYGRDRFLVHHPAAGELRLAVIPPGVSPPPPAPAAEEPSEPYFLTVSTIEPRKNHLGLLRSFGRARAAGLPLRWKVVGPAGHRSEPIIAALRASPAVDVLGEVNSEQLEALYRGASFLASPSHAEGFGFSPLEAMARGIPVVCSTGSGFDETVDGAALQVPPDDAPAWAAALSRMQSDGALRDSLVAAGPQRARMFAWEHTASSLHALFRDCVEGCRADAG